MMQRPVSRLLLFLLLLILGTMFLLTTADGKVEYKTLAPTQATIGRSPPQVALTASYSIIGGGGSLAQDILTYVSNGAVQVAILTYSPTVYNVDSGTQWSVQAILNGSTNAERWMTNQDVSGTISAPLTVSFSYYHQFRFTFNFNVTRGGNGYTGPSVTYSQLGSSVSTTAPQTVWADASSSYSYDTFLPGSGSSERWALTVGGSGTVNATRTVMASYNHEFLLTASYSVVDGGSPVALLSSSLFGTTISFPLSTSTQSAWVDAGASYSFTSTVNGTTGERWQGTVLIQTQSGPVLSLTSSSGAVIGPLTIAPVYYHQYFVTLSFNFVGGSISGLTPPYFSYQSFGSKASQSNNTAVWVDAGIQYTLPETFCCSSSERWHLNNATTGTINRSTKISSTFYHQFYDNFSYSVVGQQSPPQSAQPVLTYYISGSTQQLTLSQTPQPVWADAASTYYVANTLPGSTLSTRWFAPGATGGITGPAPNNSVMIIFYQQYLVTIVGGGVPSQWANAGNSTTLTTPAVFGRSQGIGFRVTSYQIDNGAISPVSVTNTSLAIQLSMNGPHTITFTSVRQFQLTLDAGATGAISSITPPTVPGDTYWYDTGTALQVAMNGAYGRAHGMGQRIVTIAATAQPTKQVDTVGLIQAYSSPAMQSPISITTTSATQYAVVLNNAALSAFSSISPASTFPNDTFWYDSGAPGVTVTLNAVYSRSNGAGFRVTSWEIDSGPVTPIASSAKIVIPTRAMSSPHSINATIVAQYQVTVDTGGKSALALMSNTPIPSDAGWYDASSPVEVVMNGVWGRTSGTGQRLAGYSINGGPQVAVASMGTVLVFNVTKLNSPEAVTTTVVTQFQVTLDTLGASDIASMTAAPIAKDNNWFDAGAPVSVTLNGVWGRTATSGNRLSSYSVNQGATVNVLSSNQVQVLSLSGISALVSITTKAVTQYHLTSSPIAWAMVTPPPTLSGDAPGWYDSGTPVKAVYNETWNQTPSGSRSDIVSYSVDGGSKTTVPRSGSGNFSVSVKMSSTHTISLISVTQYLLTIVGPTQTTMTPPSQTGDGYLDSGSKVIFTVPTMWNATSKAGIRQVLTSYSLDGADPIAVNVTAGASTFSIPVLTVTQAHMLTFNSVTQYQVSFRFFDGFGRSIVQPSVMQLLIGNASKPIDVHGQSQWFPNGTSFRVASVIWEGASVGPTPSPSFTLQGTPLNVTLDTRVFPVSLKVIDTLGLPVSGAQVSMILANGTVVHGTTRGDGTFSLPMVPLGTFTADVSNLGSTVHLTENSPSDQPIAQGRVALSFIMLGMIAAVVGAAGTGAFFLFRRRKSGKKATSD